MGINKMAATGLCSVIMSLQCWLSNNTIIRRPGWTDPVFKDARTFHTKTETRPSENAYGSRPLKSGQEIKIIFPNHNTDQKKQKKQSVAKAGAVRT